MIFLMGLIPILSVFFYLTISDKIQEEVNVYMLVIASAKGEF